MQKLTLAISLLTLIVCLGVTVHGLTYAQSPAAPTRWEYRIIDQNTAAVPTNDSRDLNTVGARGWELVGSFSYEDRTRSSYTIHEVFTLKRPLH